MYRLDAEMRFPLPKVLEVIPDNRTEHQAGTRIGYGTFLCIAKQQLHTCIRHKKPVPIEQVGGVQARRNILDFSPSVEDWERPDRADCCDVTPKKVCI